MTSRVLRTVVTMGLLIAAYWAYALVVVPWTEPEVVKSETTISADAIAAAKNRLPAQVAKLRRYFPDGAPELDNPVVLESPEFMLLLKDYGSNAEQQMHVKPCTLVFFPDANNRSDAEARRVIILRAPEGAVLDFDEGFSLERGKVSKLLGGRLVGEVTIYGQLGEGGDGNDLKITTRDIQLTSERVWTPHEVTFRIGDSYGSGSDLQIDMLTGPVTDPKRTPQVTGVGAVSLARDVQLHLATNSAGLLPSDGPKTSKPPIASGPVEVRCEGAFRFDVDGRVATFENQVQVVHPNPEGPGDTLNCDLLAIYFSTDPPPPGAVAPKPASRSSQPPAAEQLGKIRPTKIVAQGAPVLVQSPTRNASAQGDHLQYDFDTGTIQLEGNPTARLMYQTHVIESKRLQYTPGKNGGLGSAVAAGPGQLLASLPDKPNEVFRAAWQQELRVRPHEGKQLISLLGGATASFGAIGRLSSEQLWLWFVETPPTSVAAQPPRPAAQPATLDGGSIGNLKPHSLLARGNVELDSPRLIGLTEQLEIWFRDEPLTTPGAQQNGGGPLSNLGGGAADGSQSQYQVGGKLIRVQLATNGKDVRLQDVSIEGNVRLTESMVHPTDQPLRLTGDQLQLLRVDSPDTMVSVVGKPADLELRGVGVVGDDIRLSKAANRVWIDGPGKISLPMNRDLNGQPLAQSEKMQVDWQGRMNFDGQLLRIERDVVARNRTQSLHTAAFTAQLTRPINFAAPPDPSEIAVARADCLGGVLLENRTLEQLKLTSIDRLHTRDMQLFPPSGTLRANGPGWITSVRAGALNGLSGIGGAARSSNNAPAASPAGKEQLSFLKVTFEKGIDGNQTQRELIFSDRIRGVFGPVDNWNAELSVDASSELRENDVLLTCDRLIVREIGPPVGQTRPIELEADNNVQVSGQTFDAWARRMTYAAAKQMLVFEGTAQTDARLAQQQYVGGPTTNFAARKIIYWNADRRVQIEDARFLQTERN